MCKMIEKKKCQKIWEKKKKKKKKKTLSLRDTSKHSSQVSMQLQEAPFRFDTELPSG